MYQSTVSLCTIGTVPVYVPQTCAVFYDPVRHTQHMIDPLPTEATPKLLCEFGCGQSLTFGVVATHTHITPAGATCATRRCCCRCRFAIENDFEPTLMKLPCPTVCPASQ